MEAEKVRWLDQGECLYHVDVRLVFVVSLGHYVGLSFIRNLREEVVLRMLNS